ncbi:MAG: hypothetical protein IJ789_03090 [Bacteroidales bacterium]|nr:hypothetical protein [Bacteroidales bacterium]
MLRAPILAPSVYGERAFGSAHLYPTPPQRAFGALRWGACLNERLRPAASHFGLATYCGELSDFTVLVFFASRPRE